MCAIVGDQLDGDGAVERELTRAVDDAHPAPADDRLELVAGDDVGGLERAAGEDVVHHGGVGRREPLAQPAAVAIVRPEPDRRSSAVNNNSAEAGVVTSSTAPESNASCAPSAHAAASAHAADHDPDVPNRMPASAASASTTAMMGRLQPGRARSGLPRRTVAVALACSSGALIGAPPDMGVS